MTGETAPDELQNIVLLTVDALRADHCSWYGYERETTPTLDRLADDHVGFENAYSASSHTREAIPAMLTGRYPDVAVDANYELAADSIATLLRDTEYATGAIHSNPFVSRGFGYDRDFDHFDDDLRFGQHRVIALAQRWLDKLRRRHYARAETINERVLEFVDDVEEPFFLWTHYMDPHGPYCPPDEYQTLYHDEQVSMKHAQELYWRAAAEDPDSVTDAERREMVNMYDAEIRYVDEQIGSLLDSLRDRGVLEESLVIVTADHGDGFGEHGYYGHPRELDEATLHVPMVMVDPEGAGEIEVEAATSTLDVVPTLLSAVGESVRDHPGESLRSIAAAPEEFGDRVVFSQARSEDGERRRFAARTRKDGCELERSIETGEITSHPATSELEEVLIAHSAERIDEADETTADLETGESNKEVDRRLEALGYK